MKQATVILTILAALICGCSNQQSGRHSRRLAARDSIREQMLRGLWLEDNSEVTVMHIHGDTVYFPDKRIAPCAYEVRGDTLYMGSSSVAHYHIDYLDSLEMTLRTMTGNKISVHKSSDTIPSIELPREYSMPVYDEQTRRDSVCASDGHRYHAYVFINPSDIRVPVPIITEEGLSVTRIYYDNIIHICVYEGKRKIFGRDMRKSDFEEVIPKDFYQSATLSDIRIKGIRDRHFIYYAYIGRPESSVCYVAEIQLTSDGQIKIQLI